MRWVALDLDDLFGLLIHERQQTAGRFTVKARGGHEHVVLLHLAWMCFRVVHNDVVPGINWWVVRDGLTDSESVELRSIAAHRRRRWSPPDGAFSVTWLHLNCPFVVF
jgi:hypothetical protein